MKLTEGSSMQKLSDFLPQQGKVVWIGIRPERKIDLISITEVKAIENSKLEGDHHSGRKGSKRQVTLIQQEHLNAVASYLQMENFISYIHQT